MKRLAAILSGLLIATVMTGAALAVESDPEDVVTGGNGSNVVWTYDPGEGTLVISVVAPGGELPECTGGDDDMIRGSDRMDADDAPEGCFVVQVEAAGASHGTFVSAVATALHPSLLPDGVNKGQIMREIAKSDLGKGAADDDEAGVPDDDDAVEQVQDEAKAERKAAHELVKAERKAARDEMKAERKAAHELVKAERKAARDQMKAERKAARDEMKVERKSGKPHGKPGGGGAIG